MQIQLSEEEINAVRQAISLRLSLIRGYGLNEEEYLQSVQKKLAKG